MSNVPANSILSLLSARTLHLIGNQFYTLVSNAGRMRIWENMIFQILFIIFMFCGTWSEETDQKRLKTAAKIEEESEKPQRLSMCDVCSCKDLLVNCSYRGLENHFENSDWPNTSMEEVSFKGNSLIHVKPFPPVVIRRLILRENKIVKIDDAAFKQLKNLTELDLSHNQLTSELLQPSVFEGRFSPEAYEPLAKLTILNLGSNALHTLHQDLFEHLSSLKVLLLHGNPFTVIDHSTIVAISNLPYLEELDLSYCSLKNLPEHIFHTPRFLKKVHLTGNLFTTVPTSLEDAKSLEYLCLDDNPIESVDYKNAFPLMTKLKELSLCCMKNLTKVGPGAFSGLTGLEALHLAECPGLTDIDEDALVRKTSEGAIWPQLKVLELSDNALQYLPAGLVGRWDKLEELDLKNNQWICDCDNQFLVGSLLPDVGQRLMGNDVDSLICSAPPEHAGKNLTSLANRHLRCLDLYGTRPEKDAAILVGMLIGVLLAIPVTLSLFVFWRRGFFFCGTQGPATFSRAFYKRTENEDDF